MRLLSIFHKRDVLDTRLPKLPRFEFRRTHREFAEIGITKKILAATSKLTNATTSNEDRPRLTLLRAGKLDEETNLLRGHSIEDLFLKLRSRLSMQEMPLATLKTLYCSYSDHGDI
jgi:hypothetical protein